MHHHIRRWFGVALVITAVAVFNSACESGGSSSAPAPSVDITGVWRGPCNIGGDSTTTSLNLSQTGSSVSGTLEGTLSLSGTVSGNTADVTGSAIFGTDVTTVRLRLSVSGSTMAVTGTREVTDAAGTTTTTPLSCTLSRN